MTRVKAALKRTVAAEGPVYQGDKGDSAFSLNRLSIIKEVFAPNSAA